MNYSDFRCLPLVRDERLSILIVALLTVSVLAMTAHAQDGSPAQVEYTVPDVAPGANVDEFSGDFTYGIPILHVPGPNGGGHTVMLSYRSGANPDHASWVGYGWSINPGAIVRQQKGFADDWQGQIAFTNRAPMNYSVSATYGINAEFASHDEEGNRSAGLIGQLGVSLGGSATHRYDNNTGFAKIYRIGGGASFIGNYVGVQFMNNNGEWDDDFILSPNLWTTGAYLAKSRLYNLFSRMNMPDLVGPPELALAPPLSIPIGGKTSNYGLKFGLNIGSGVFAGADMGVSANVMQWYTMPQHALNAYGYLRSAYGQDDSSGLMDYGYESDLSYALTDKRLPIPYSSADDFVIVGGGRFRAFHRDLGVFHQNSATSEIDVNNDEFKITAGVKFPTGSGFGYRWGDGSITYESDRWSDRANPVHQRFGTSGDEPWFFRMSGDLGGNLLYDDDDAAVRAEIVDSSWWVSRFPRLSWNLGLPQQKWQRPGRAAYIGYTLNSEMLDSSNGIPYRSYNRSEDSRAHVADRERLNHGIGEFALYGGDGSRSVYGTPVYARNQNRITLGLERYRMDSAVRVANNAIAFRYTDISDAKTASGEHDIDPHAIAWLLTERTSPDYVDVSNDGPTDDDLGGWTKFHYQRVAGTDSKVQTPPDSWAYWRVPYRGLQFSPSGLSDPDDDAGSFIEGVKEIYYLERIETATHVAVFVLNEPWDARKDDYGQAYPNSLIARKNLAGDSTITGAHSIEYNQHRRLERIELYAKGVLGSSDSLLNIIRFEYDYSLRPNMPSSLKVHLDSTTRLGVLSLRKVWAEPQGLKPSHIQPYIFGYNYRDRSEYAATVQSRYPQVVGFADSLDAQDENPPYSPTQLDRWGYYRSDGETRSQKHNPWVNQSPSAHFDPAAWQLKWIRQPTGGELHIHYEQDDYAFVHDRPATAMVSLIDTVFSDSSLHSADGESANLYYLRLSDIGIDSTDQMQIAKVRESIEELAKRDGKLLFRLLYALKGDEAALSAPEWSSEYIEGYTQLYDITTTEITPPTGPVWYALGIQLKGGTGAKLRVPRAACLEIVNKRKRGKLGPDGGIAYSTDDEDMIWELLGFPGPGVDDVNHCKNIEYKNSYIRIPTLNPKKGGGLRVLRLLTYDPGIEGDSSLYGTEYRYEYYDNRRGTTMSSGVATNEPMIGRSENALVTYLSQEASDDDAKETIYGAVRSKNEGPIGEGILPSASVGYARVIKSPINTGLTGPGFSVSDYYTCRDYPYDAVYSGIGNAFERTDINEDHYRTPAPAVNLLILHMSENIMRATQGYRFVRTEMHGKSRRHLTCAHTYEADERNWLVSASSEQSYFQPGEPVPLLSRLGDSIRYGSPGKEMEVVQATRQNIAYVNDFKIEGDIGIFYLSGIAYSSIDNSELRTHVTTKIAEYPAIVKSVRTYSDGAYSYREHAAFDPGTGAPVITRHFDGHNGYDLVAGAGAHNGIYHHYAIPAYWYYDEMGKKAVSERAVLLSTSEYSIRKGHSGGAAFLVFSPNASCRWQAMLSEGDFIELSRVSDGAEAGLYHVDSIMRDLVWLAPAQSGSSWQDAALQRTGEVNLDIIRSGRANRLVLPAGNVVTYGQTKAKVSDSTRFGFPSASSFPRHSFVALLNSGLAAGYLELDSLTPSSAQFKHYVTGECTSFQSMQDTFCLSTSPDQRSVYIWNPAHTDTLTNLGRGGYFALDDDGQIVYRSIGEECCEQRATLFTFCGNIPRRTASGVVSAAAFTLGDKTEPNDQLTSTNAFEDGSRGRWLPRSTHSYRTTVTPDPALGGTYQSFSLFNWRSPKLLDTACWRRADSVIVFDRHARALESVDALNRPATTGFAYGPLDNSLPVYRAWNAQQGSVAFESFENYAVGSLSGCVVSSIAHSGTKSIALTSGYAINLAATEQVLSTGLLIRFWMPITMSAVTINVNGAATFDVTGAHRLASVGEWALYELRLESWQLSPLVTLSQPLTIGFQPTDTNDVPVLDDIRIHPTDAVMAGNVYDPHTYRQIAMLGEDHFSHTRRYDARGVAIALEVETEAGSLTAGEAHSHVASVGRSFLDETGTMPNMYDRVDGIRNSQLGVGTAGPQEPLSTSPVAFELLDIELGVDRQAMKVFGVEPSQLRAFFESEIETIGLPTGTELRELERFDSLEAVRGKLIEASLRDVGDIRASEDRREIARIVSQQDDILKRLGVSREELEHYINATKEQ